ncbi:MAG: hypothetical protein H0Z34_13200 [Brevibacillus sp.]|nr:hypothetical protein [Brevibacillus sp.]
MDEIMQRYVSTLVQRGHVQSVLWLAGGEKCSPFLDGANVLSLVVNNRSALAWESGSQMVNGLRLVEHTVSMWQMEQWAVQGAPEKIVHWVSQARIVFDQGDYMKKMRDRLLHLSKHTQKRKICEEYSLFLRHYLEAKELLKQDLVLDSYHTLTNAFYHWARLVICEAGEQPGEMLWKQVRRIEPSVCKLYEELICGQEPLAKRIELQLLPIELTVKSKMRGCTTFLAEILQSRSRPWLLDELQQHPSLVKANLDLPLLLENMAARSIVQEVMVCHADVASRGYILAG